jgi:aspartyl/glutamyl-tRNA(Asn/Gln) amidotransferase C subunit
LSWISRIELTEDELERFQHQIDDTIMYIDVLETFETESFDVDSQNMDFSSLREDKIVVFSQDIFPRSVITPEGFVKGPKMI